MPEEKNIKIRNRSDKPDNIVLKEHEIVNQCTALERTLPTFLRGFFVYLKGNVLPMTRLNYLRDISFFCRYLISETDITGAAEPSGIKLSEFNEIKAVDINIFLDYCRQYTVEKDNEIVVYENSNRTLARKKSSLSVMFKQLYRDDLILSLIQI